MNAAAAAIGVALVIDLLVGELPDRIHPVAWFGRGVALTERPWPRPVVAGVGLALMLPTVVAIGVGLVAWAVAARGPWWAVGIGTVVLFSTTSYRSLLRTVRRVSATAETDLAEARRDLLALAGRDAADLEAGQVRSAALESLGENLSDGLVAPLLAFAIGAAAGPRLGLSPGGALGLACAGAVWIKAVNTMDSMWGYPERPLGTGAARLDDLAMWLPARVTAALLAIAFAAPGSVRRAAGWFDPVSSPNAGWPMGVVAAALDVRLEKPGHYVLNDGASLPTPSDVRRGLRRVGLAGLLAYALAGVIAWS